VVTSRWMSALALVAVAATLVGSGCSETLPLSQLPDVTKLPEKVLNKDEQQGKVKEKIAKGQSHDRERQVTRLAASATPYPFRINHRHDG
jgi:hypothetical protein